MRTNQNPQPKIDWRRKLSSRKFWAAFIGFIAAFLLVFNTAPESIEKITAIIMSGASLIAYILAEGWVDSKIASTTPTEIEDTAPILSPPGGA